MLRAFWKSNFITVLCEGKPAGFPSFSFISNSYLICRIWCGILPEEYKALVNRLSRIEGQVRGVRGMLEKDAYCVDILVQVAAVNSALNSFAKELLAQHMSTCVADDLRAGSDEKLNELIKLLPRLMK